MEKGQQGTDGTGSCAVTVDQPEGVSVEIRVYQTYILRPVTVILGPRRFTIATAMEHYLHCSSQRWPWVAQA